MNKHVYQGNESNALVTAKGKVLVPRGNSQEVHLGYPKGFTFTCGSSQRRRDDPHGRQRARPSLTGNRFHAGASTVEAAHFEGLLTLTSQRKPWSAHLATFRPKHVPRESGGMNLAISAMLVIVMGWAEWRSPWLFIVKFL